MGTNLSASQEEFLNELIAEKTVLEGIINNLKLAYRADDKKLEETEMFILRRLIARMRSETEKRSNG